MKAACISRLGDPDVIEYGDLSDPEALSEAGAGASRDGGGQGTRVGKIVLTP